MDNLKGWKPYVVLLGVLILLLIYTQWKESRYQPTEEPIFKAKPASIVSFTIARDMSVFTIARQDSSWIFKGPDTGVVDTMKVRQFLESVMTAKREDYVTEDTSKHLNYDVAGSRAVKLIVRHEHGEETVYLGRSRSDYSREYIRFQDDPRVYLMHDGILGLVGATISYWRK